MTGKFLVFIVWLLPCFPLFGQVQGVSELKQQYHLIHYDQKEGLIPSYINDLAIDSIGQIQLATLGSGIISYDGFKFMSNNREGLSNHPIIRKLKLIDQVYYFVTSDEMYAWNETEGSLRQVFKGNSPIIYFQKSENGKLLVSNYNGNYIVTQANDGTFQTEKLALHLPITDLLKTSSGNWLGIFGDKQLVLNPMGQNPTTILEFKEGEINKVIETDNCIILLQSGAALFLDKGDYTILKRINLPSDLRFSVFYQQADKLWLAGDQGLFTLEKEELTKINTFPQLEKIDISAITETLDGTIWIATYGNGLYKLYNTDISELLEKDRGLGQVNSVVKLKKSKDTFLITSNRGIFYLNDKEINKVNTPKTGNGDIFFTGVEDDSGNLYIGGEGFVLKKELQRETFQVFLHDVFENNLITCIVRKGGRIYIGSRRGLYLFDEEFNLIKDYNTGSVIKPRNVSQINLIDENRIVFGNSFNLYETSGNGIIPFETDSIKGKVLSFTPVKESLYWLGSSSGILYLFDFQQGKILREIHSNYGKNIYSVSIAPDSSVVIGTEMGIEKHLKNGEVMLYDDRLRFLEVNYNSLVHNTEGDLLVGTMAGLLRVSANYSHKSKGRPILEAFMVNNRPRNIQNNIKNKADLVLAHHENNLSFKVKLVNYMESQYTQVRYQLLGYEDEPGPIMNDGSVQYTNLPPGEYQIITNIQYSQGDIIAYNLPLTIIIRNPYWLHPVFMVLVLVLALSGVFLGYVWFQRKTIQRNKKLSRLVEERTKEIKLINKNLEQLVLHRTSDLHAKNRELTLTVEQKNRFQQYVRLISANTQDIVCLITPDYEINLISDSVNEMLGFSASKVINHNIKELLLDENSSQHLITYLEGLGDTPSPITLPFLHQETHKNIQVEILARKVFDKKSGLNQGYVLNFRDVSEREFLKSELKAVYKNIHRDFHDEVGNKLARIIALISVLKIQLDEYPVSSETMGKIEGTAKNLFRDTRDFVWSLDQENNKLEELSIQLRDFGENLFDGSSIQFNCDLNIHKNLLLKPNIVRDLLLIMKEVMTNVLKHSQATVVRLKVKQCGNHMIFLVQDDGIGLKSHLNGKGNGLKNIQFRAIRCNGELVLRSGKGTLAGVRIKAY